MDRIWSLETAKSSREIRAVYEDDETIVSARYIYPSCCSLCRWLLVSYSDVSFSQNYIVYSSFFCFSIQPKNIYNQK
jgi:hypothetical protein